MTEADWLESTDPATLLACLEGRASPRKLQLYTCACCRVVWNLLIDERSRRAVEAAEEFADGLIDEEEAKLASSLACTASLEVRRKPEEWSDTTLRLRRPHDPDKVWRAAVMAAYAAGGAGSFEAHLRGAAGEPLDGPIRCELLREIFGNPFRPIRIEEAWRTRRVVFYASEIYNERGFDLMPALAEALKVAGCTEAELLNHCRQSGVHVRGCWVLDSLLDKE